MQRFPDPSAPVRFRRRDRNTPLDVVLQMATFAVMMNLTALFLGS